MKKKHVPFSLITKNNNSNIRRWNRTSEFITSYIFFKFIIDVIIQELNKILANNSWQVDKTAELQTGPSELQRTSDKR